MANYELRMNYESSLVKMNKFFDCMQDAAEELAPSLHQRREWNPYSSQGGTSAALAGDDFVVLASDSRMSDQFISSRVCEKTHILTNKILMGTCGFGGDVLQLKRLLKYRINHFAVEYQVGMSLEQCGQMLSNILYSRRFFPYFTGINLCGIDSKGRGTIFSYDPIGNTQRSLFDASGMGGQILTTFFEHSWALSTFEPEKRKQMPKATLERALSLMRDAFRGLSERETTTGDSIHLYWVKAGEDKVYKEVVRLRGD